LIGRTNDADLSEAAAGTPPESSLAGARHIGVVTLHLLELNSIDEHLLSLLGHQVILSFAVWQAT
jgi:hypothetical protein